MYDDSVESALQTLPAEDDEKKTLPSYIKQATGCHRLVADAAIVRSANDRARDRYNREVPPPHPSEVGIQRRHFLP